MVFRLNYLKATSRFAVIVFLLLMVLLTAACVSATRRAPAHPTQSVSISQDLQEPDIAAGQTIFARAHCSDCHGSQAQGNVGPTLARTSLPFKVFLSKVRTALPPKPAYSPDELSDQEAYDIFGWLQGLSAQEPPTKLPQSPAITIVPGQKDLPPGEILGMSMWTGMSCSQCHGAFAQGSKDGPALAGISDPPEVLLQNMRKTADTIPEHAADYMTDPVFERLYHWLQSGANPTGGC